MHLKIAFSDTLEVYADDQEEPIGEISLMSTGWAVYRLNASGFIITPRIGTYKTAEQAVKALR